ncbi:MAG: hypothetical protein HY299_18525 [Verrucomicrobia bacterium]|nr:hypothetical protein [Verrucomicrobiota bacterium]
MQGYYNAATGRWLSKDPMEEEGGVNLYSLLSNDPVDELDVLGFGPCEDKFRGKLKNIANSIAKWRASAKAHEREIKDRLEDIRKDLLEQKHKGSWPGAKPSETREGHWELLNKHKAWKAAAEAMAQAAIEEFQNVMAQYAACKVAEKSLKAAKCLKKFMGPLALGYKLYNDGIDAAFDDALWPASTLWADGPSSMPSIDSGDSNGDQSNPPPLKFTFGPNANARP